MFEWHTTQVNLSRIPNTIDKIAYLIAEKTEYLQSHKNVDNIETKPSYAEQCQLEIDKLKEFNKLTKQTTDTGIDIDLSDTKAKGKIIYLKELGVLDILKSKQPFNTSINALASVLSAITGEQLTTLQSYLNPMFSPNTDNKNDPYNNKKNVEKVKKQLIRIGFQSK